VELWIAQRGVAPAALWQARFYSDSHNDLPLLEAVAEPIAVDPDPPLRRVAEARGWPILSLGERDGRPSLRGLGPGNFFPLGAAAGVKPGGPQGPFVGPSIEAAMRSPLASRRRGARAGFSMLELVCACSVLLIATVAAAQAQLSANALIEDARQTQLALGVLEEALEQVHQYEVPELLGGGAPFEAGEAIPVSLVPLRAQRVWFETPGFAGGVAPTTLEVQVTVEWIAGKAQARRLSLSSLVR
jgi:hypothetical protein